MKGKESAIILLIKDVKLITIEINWLNKSPEKIILSKEKVIINIIAVKIRAIKIVIIRYFKISFMIGNLRDLLDFFNYVIYCSLFKFKQLSFQESMDKKNNYILILFLKIS